MVNHPRFLQAAQSIDKSVFEYWTHALSYISTEDFWYFVRQMKNMDADKSSWFGSVTESDYKKVKALLKKGAITIRDIKDDVLVEKSHAWASSKPSKRALRRADVLSVQ